MIAACIAGKPRFLTPQEQADLLALGGVQHRIDGGGELFGRGVAHAGPQAARSAITNKATTLPMPPNQKVERSVARSAT